MLAAEGGGAMHWKPVLQKMIEEGYGKKRMSRETSLSYNTVKTYLARIVEEAVATGNSRS